MVTGKIELMAPVGSYESLMAAIQGGAGSVYFGIENLNMRARSLQNFTIDDLKAITSICREHTIRSYVTLNTVIYDDELPLMREIATAAKEHGISALIASDQAVIRYANQIGMEVHMSTQTNITNIEAVKYYARFAGVVVLARELNLDQVAVISRAIREQQVKGPSGRLIRLEIFVHGALCMAVSGKCYLSLDNLNSSANRGACYQVCRRPYRVFDHDGEIELEVDNEYIMSPKDLNTIDFLDKILEAGVTVLKIEGRGRGPEYVKTVTQCYREAIDSIAAGTYSPEKIAQWNERLKTVYNRGFWGGYYLGRKMGEWSNRHGSEATRRKVYVGLVTNYFTKIKVAEIKIETQSLTVGDEILIIGPTTGVVEETIREIRHDLNPVEQVNKGDVCSIPVDTFLRRSDKVYRLDKA